MGSVISANWIRLEREVHTLTPYHRLAQSPAPASSTILIRRRSLPFSAFVSMIYHQHYFAASFALLALLSEVLVITLGGIPFNPDQVHREYLISNFTSMAILVLMLCGMVYLVLWRRKTPDLPRAPNTLLGVMSYLADSKMLDDFEGLELLKKTEIDNRIAGMGKRYGYGRFVGVDGQVKWMVDEESSFVSETQ